MCLHPFQHAHQISRGKQATAGRCINCCIYTSLNSDRRNRIGLLQSIFDVPKENNSNTILLHSLPNTPVEIVLITYVTSVISTHTYYPLVTSPMTHALQLPTGHTKILQ
jgi:hypothetical protein